MCFRICIILALFAKCVPTFAQQNPTTLFSQENAFPIIHDMNWLNEQFLAKQRTRLEEVTSRSFGQQLKQGKANFPLLQRLITEGRIERDDTITLQAMGVILGDAYVEEKKDLEWRVFEDAQGKSLAVCVNNSEHCLFPITMLSRRIEVGSKPDVNRVYKKGLDAISPYLPKRAYSN